MNVINVGVLTISDRCAREEAVDESGSTLIDMVRAGIVKNGTVIRTHLVPDCKEDIEEVLKRWCDDDNIHLILTTGGTGLSERDVTPEATAAVLDRTVPGIPHLMFKHSSAVTPLAALSRAIAGIRGRSLIINLPGSKKASRECLEAVASVIPHAVDVIYGRKEEVQGVHMGLIRKKSSVLTDRAADRRRMSPFPCISVAKAQEIVISAVNLLKKEIRVEFEQALDHVLAQEVVAENNHPPFDVSLKDGYAVRSEDQSFIKTLIGVCNVAEWPSNIKVTPGSCARVSTGGPIPPGADAVVEVENTSLQSLNEQNEEHTISFCRLPKSGAEIRKKASDFAVGQVLMKWGTYLNSGGVSILAAAGITRVRVYRKPLVAIMSTGNELSDPHEPLKPGKVRDSNKILLINMLKEENYDAVDLGIVPDDPNSLRDSLEKGFRAADVVVTTGSMSMGERDFMKDVIAADFNGEIGFGRVLVKPGKPTAFGVLNFEGKSKVWFGLPGNPVSAFVCSHLFLLPGLRKISGQENVFSPSVDALVEGSLPNKLERPQYLRGIINLTESTVSLLENQSSSCLESCLKANCLVVLPENSENYNSPDRGCRSAKSKTLLLSKRYN